MTQRTVEAKTEAVVVDSLPGWFEALDGFAEKLAAIKVLLRGRNVLDASLSASHAAADAIAHVCQPYDSRIHLRRADEQARRLGRVQRVAADGI